MGIATVRILHLYPQELNLYGDAGNVLCLQRRLEARGFGVRLLYCGIGEQLPDFDILFIGGGQDREMQHIARDTRRKGDALRHAIYADKVILAVCGGYQLLGERYLAANGDCLTLSGALPFSTEGGKKRMIGNLVFRTPFGTAVGFENHCGKTVLPNGLPPLGTVLYGCGNNGADKTEGLLFHNTFGTYAHGPLLPKNPNIADALIMRALGTERLAPLDDTVEIACHDALIARFR